MWVHWRKLLLVPYGKKWKNNKFGQAKDFSNEMDLRTEPILHSQDIANYQDVSHKGHAKMNYYIITILISSRNLVDTSEYTGQPRLIQA